MHEWEWKEYKEVSDFNTVYMHDIVSRCESVDELREEILPMIKSQSEQWIKKIKEIIRETGLNQTEFGEAIGVSKMCVSRWCQGAVPRRRETFLRIGMLAGYNKENMNKLLQRYGRYPALYSKSLEDCVCIFVLEHNDLENPIEEYEYIVDKITEKILGRDKNEAENIPTEVFDEKLSEVKSETELEKFIDDNTDIFSKAYHRFFQYVEASIAANTGGTCNVHEIAEAQGWTSSLRQAVSAVRQRKWKLGRNNIISLGIHLAMELEEINCMLNLAHMEPLCANNIFESMIIYILEDASVNGVLDTMSENYDPDGLCVHAKKILEELKIPEGEKFLVELTDVMEDEI